MRQIGKRSLYLNRKAIEVAEEIRKMDSKAARWVGSNALRGLTSEAVQKRFDDSGINFTACLRVKEHAGWYRVRHGFIKRLHRRYAQEGV